MKFVKIPVLCLSAVFLLTGCGGGNNGKDKGAGAREEWTKSLEDSLRSVEDDIVEATSGISRMRVEIDSMLQNFERVDDARLVEGYTVYKGWRNYNTASGTGIFSRMLDDGSLEIVASLRNGDFNNIRVVSDRGSCLSDTVPYDNALNYRSGNVDIVAFGGDKADSIGALVARSIDIPVRLEYIGRKGVVGSVQLTHDQKEMIAATWRIVDVHRKLNRTERMLPLYNEKIRVLKSRLD